MCSSDLIARRVNKFNAKFPDAIELLVRGLRSGLPISETMAVVGAEVPGSELTLGVRPEHIRQGGPNNLLQSTVAFVESLGGITFAYCPYPGLEEPLTCQFEGRNGVDRLRSGQALDLHLPEEALYVFDSNGRSLRRLAAPELAA